MAMLGIAIIVAAIISSLAYLGAKFSKESGDVGFMVMGGIIFIGMCGLSAIKEVNKQNCHQIENVKHIKQVKDKNESK